MFQGALKLPEVNFVTTDKYGFLKLEPSRDVGKFFILIRLYLILLVYANVALRYNPSHLEMDEISYIMRFQWRVVARFIVPFFTDFEIKEIELEEREDQPLRFLQAWIRKHGLKATREALSAALFSADLGSGVREVFPEIYENMTKVFYCLNLRVVV